MQKGDRVLYRPGSKRKGLEMPDRQATVLAVYPHEHQVRIKCDGEIIQRRVRTQYLEILSG